MRAVCLLSSGLDSTVALALAREEGWEIQLALTLDYGQRAAAKEKEHGERIARFLAIPFCSLRLPWFGNFRTGGSLLNSGESLPTPEDLDLSDPSFTRASAQSVWVPNRNGVFIEVAAGFAEDRGAEAILVGFNREEAETFPDNSLEYIHCINRALSFSTRNKVKVISPTSLLNKTEIVKEALRLDFPLPLLWSCYESGDKMCGRCESCRRLKRALRTNGVDLYDQFTD